MIRPARVVMFALTVALVSAGIIARGAEHADCRAQVVEWQKTKRQFTPAQTVKAGHMVQGVCIIEELGS